MCIVYAFLCWSVTHQDEYSENTGSHTLQADMTIISFSSGNLQALR